MYGDLRQIALEPFPGEACRVEPVSAYFTRKVHIMIYGRRARTLLADQWDMVHCWEEPYVFPGFQVCRWVPPTVPFVFWTAQNLQKWYPPPFSWFEQYCIRRCAGWLACGQTVVDTMLRRGYSSKPNRIIPLGVDTKVFCPDPVAGAAVLESLGWDRHGPPVVGYLGRFVTEKGVSLLSRVLDRLQGEWRALFVGGGPLQPELQSWAARHGDRVRICTGVSHDQVPSYLNAMDVLAAPSQTRPRWREQLGRMLIEAFACGIPVVGSDSGEIPHVIGDAGQVVGEADEASWAKVLADLLESPAQRAELAQRGLERAEREFSWPIIARRHLDFFTEVLDSRVPAS
jgi:glycosyltransferase involved in cell wall biosynthesis